MMRPPSDSMRPDGGLHGLLRAPTEPRGVGAILVLLVLLLWILVVYGRTTLSMASIWERSETFAHGFVVLPIVLYLIWRERAAIASAAPRPFLPAVAMLAALGGVWLVATRLDVNSIAQFAMVAMVPTAAWAVLGSRIMRELAFPLAFLFFAVPFGEFLIPVLMDWTADITIAAVRASGIPVYREGNYFTIPSGHWSIVEACSGLRYLIASLMVGCLFAYVSFRSPARRALFVVASIAVPIVANWVRAYLIVILGHVSGNRIAAGADHLVYGWLFFGVVMALLFWIGARWREDGVPVPSPVVPAGNAPDVAAPPSWRLALALALTVTAVFPLLAWMESPDADLTPPTRVAIAGTNGWNPAPAALSEWRPDVAGATVWYTQTFEKNGAKVALILAAYEGAAGRKAITSTNQLVRTVNKEWTQMDAGSVRAAIGGGDVAVRTAVVAGRRERLAVWQWYWVDGHVTSSDVAAKFRQGLALLRGRTAVVAWVVLATLTDRGEREGRAALAMFAADMNPRIDAALRGAESAP